MYVPWGLLKFMLINLLLQLSFICVIAVGMFQLIMCFLKYKWCIYSSALDTHTLIDALLATNFTGIIIPHRIYILKTLFLHFICSTYTIY